MRNVILLNDTKHTTRCVEFRFGVVRNGSASTVCDIN